MAEKQAEVFAPDPNLKVWVDGELVGYRDASVNVFDHGLLYGDGIFEGIRSYRGRIFERIAHLDRLYASAKALTLEIPIDPPAMSKALDETLEANGLLTEDKDAYIRLVVTRGAGALGISPRKTVKPRIFVIAADLLMYPEEMYEKGMPVIISSVTRNSPNACPPRVKSLNYLNNILAKIEALDANVGEAIMLNAQGHVAEATGDNVFIVSEGQVQTPPTSAGILCGITRKTVIKLARDRGYEVVEKSLVRMDLYSADEMFLTGTGAEVIPVHTIDNRKIADGTPGPITRELIAAYRDLVRSAEDVRP
jgi:branched-chain amino acid aminotransferase